MSQIQDKEDIIEDDIENQMEEESDLYEQQEDFIEEQSQEIEKDESEIAQLKDRLARSAADLENFKKRTQRDKDDMIFFLKLDIFKKILPRLDDLERIIKNTPTEIANGALYEGILTLQKQLSKDLNNMGVQVFESIGKEVNPDKHEVMTQIPGEKDIILDEFEKGYTLGERVLRVAKVVVGSGE